MPLPHPRHQHHHHRRPAGQGALMALPGGTEAWANPPASPHGAAAPIAAAVVAKSLKPGAAGTQRWLRQYGEDLVCVRYRDDLAGQQRLVTVELVVERRPLPMARRGGEWDEVLVRISYEQTAMRQQARAAGARWDPERKLWRMYLGHVKALGWLKLIVEE